VTLRTLDSLGSLAGKRVVVRCDLNVPLEGSKITDDGRVRASIPTLNALINQGAKVVVISHLGRPDGAPDARYMTPFIRTAPLGIHTASNRAGFRVSGGGSTRTGLLNSCAPASARRLIASINARLRMSREIERAARRRVWHLCPATGSQLEDPRVLERDHRDAFFQIRFKIQIAPAIALPAPHQGAAGAASLSLWRH